MTSVLTNAAGNEECPVCLISLHHTAFATASWPGLKEHILACHVFPLREAGPPVYGPVDVKCPFCGSRQLQIVTPRWVAVCKFICVNQHQWGQWL